MTIKHDSSTSERQAAVNANFNIDAARKAVTTTIDRADDALRTLNRSLHDNPEVGYQEFKAHAGLTGFLEKRGFSVKQSTYGLETCFEAEIGEGGRLVVICAEYDALPEIGHACGHNLIATSSMAAFLGAAEALRSSGMAGRLRILGTPAEEGGGGKCKLIDANAFVDQVNGGLASAAIMAHPFGAHQMMKPGQDQSTIPSGLAGMKLIASHKLRVAFHGKTAHAGGEPWNGINALDAAVAAYNNVSMLRQQIQPDERLHGVIEVGGTVPNVIPQYTRMAWCVRSPTVQRGDRLLERVKNCFEAAALATGCTTEYSYSPTYKDLVVNRTLCQTYVDDMAALGENIMLEQNVPFNASTDMGNVSQLVPSFHGGFAIPAGPEVSAHNPAFAAAAGTDQAHQAALKCGKGMALMAIRVLCQDGVAAAAAKDFSEGPGQAEALVNGS